jgi:hypothetical protein
MEPFISGPIIFGILWLIASMMSKPVRRHVLGPEPLPPGPVEPPVAPPPRPPEPPVAPAPSKFAGLAFGSGELRDYLRRMYATIPPTLATAPPPPPPGEYQVASPILPDASNPELPRLIGARLSQDIETARNLVAAIKSAFSKESYLSDSMKIVRQVGAQMALGRVV